MGLSFPCVSIFDTMSQPYLAMNTANTSIRMVTTTLTPRMMRGDFRKSRGTSSTMKWRSCRDASISPR